MTDSLAREIGLSNYFEHVRRSFQDILKTLDCTIGRPFLMTRPDTTQQSNQLDVSDVGSVATGVDNSSGTGASNANSNLNSSQTVASNVASSVATSLPTTATSVVTTTAEVFASSSHHFNLNHSNSVGSNGATGAGNLGKSLSADLNEHAFKETNINNLT